MSAFETVRYDKRAGVAWVTLHRPDALNAYNVRMRDELAEVFAAVRDDGDVRVLVLRGAGRAFCAGADLTEFGTAPSPTIARRIRFARDVWATLLAIAAPTVAALHGYVFGSGLEMALYCDLRLAAEGTVFGMPEVRLGMIPAAGGTQTIPRAARLGPALDVLLTGRRFDAAEAERLGLVTRLVPADRLAAETETLAAALAALDPRAVRAIRRAIRDGLDLPLDQGLRLEARLAAALRRPNTPMESDP
jgi:enoyl-CoA hydratase/carnithine racemase